ncbi:bifunctional DNA primase/polymerase [Actinomadura rubrisoli]|uniref:Bifunctional DNA primase/polymerase n=1 Tax=Actinomadura rubrisoli TaxID=2530368 RepID=A0A4R5A088_9ACTN|nr:bifunctional DNA primase/polymerase [Actinomadura rubrisoli]TDD65101.1 bifunctional DNA primase/polymerase [Actinomadura rubrisoli]
MTGVPPAMLAAALGYAAHGWPVFVLSPTKVPVRNCPGCKTAHTTAETMEACACLTCHGFHAATTDPARLTAMFERYPAGLLAVRTGAASGTVVIDVDPPVGSRTLAKLDRAEVLPGTVMSMTGRSCGIQLYYAHPGVRITSRPGGLGPGVDVKADDAYVVVPPSVHPGTGRAYHWSGDGRYDYPLTPLHRVLIERLKATPPSHRSVTTSRASRAAEGSSGAFWAQFRQPSTGTPYNRLHGLVATVLKAREGERNAVLHWAACRISDMAAAREIEPGPAAQALARAALDIGLAPGEIRATINSGCPTAGTTT